LINIEENGNEIFFMVRYIIITLILFVSYFVSQKIYLMLIRK
jgi:hypothetical protein